MNIKTTQKNGFTLIELLLYVAISSLLLISVSVFLAVLLESRVKNQTIAEVEQQGLQVVQLINQTIRNAATINIPTQGASVSSLSLDTYTPALNPTVFDLFDGALRITEGVGSPVALTNSRVSATNFVVSNLSRASTPGVINIRFTLTYKDISGRNEYRFSKTFTTGASVRQP